MDKAARAMVEALIGRIGEHHTVMFRVHLAHIDHLSAGIDSLDKRVEEVIAPFADQLRRLQAIPESGSGRP